MDNKTVIVEDKINEWNSEIAEANLKSIKKSESKELKKKRQRKEDNDRLKAQGLEINDPDYISKQDKLKCIFVFKI